MPVKESVVSIIGKLSFKVSVLVSIFSSFLLSRSISSLIIFRESRSSLLWLRVASKKFLILNDVDAPTRCYRRNSEKYPKQIIKRINKSQLIGNWLSGTWREFLDPTRMFFPWNVIIINKIPKIKVWVSFSWSEMNWLRVGSHQDVDLRVVYASLLIDVLQNMRNMDRRVSNFRLH